jgi:hypothetical protein
MCTTSRQRVHSSPCRERMRLLLVAFRWNKFFSETFLSWIGYAQHRKNPMRFTVEACSHKCGQSVRRDFAPPVAERAGYSWI